MTKYFLILSIFLLSISGCKAQNQNSDWKEFITNKGKFRALFPSEPNVSVKERGEGETKIEEFSISVSQPRKTFMITYSHYPTALEMNQEQLKAHYDNFQYLMSKQANKEITTWRDVWVGERLGREFSFLDENKMSIKYRTFTIGKDFYQLIATVEFSLIEDENSKTEVNKFFDSFQILGQ